MAPPAAPTKWVLGNYTMSPAAEHPGCMEFDIRPYVLNPDDHKVGWELELKRWEMAAKDTVKYGTSEATITVEDGMYTMSNRGGPCWSLTGGRAILTQASSSLPTKAARRPRCGFRSRSIQPRPSLP